MEKKDYITVVFASNQKGVMPLSVAIWSVVETAAESTSFEICVLSDGIEAESQEKIKSLVEKAGRRHRIRFIDVSLIIPESVKVNENWPKAAWARVFLPDLLPDVSRVIYLDIDTMACTDLKELYSTHMGDNALGVVLEHESHERSHFNERLQIPLDCPGYFNSGVLLMNLAVFRRDRLVEKIMTFAETKASILYCPDQDALNGALCNRIQILHPRWNWYGGLTRAIMKEGYFEHARRGCSLKQAVEAALYPGILHYRGKENKPWHYNYGIYGKHYYKCIQRAGLYEYLPLPGWSIKKCLLKLFSIPVYAYSWLRIKKLAKQNGVTGSFI